MSGSVIQFPLRLGLAEDSNPKSSPASSLKRGENIRWVKDGVLGKSYAFSQKTELPDGAGAPVRFVVREDELSVTDGSRLYTQLPDGSWVDSDAVCEAALEWETVLDDQSGIATSDIAIAGDYIVHAWVTGDPTRRPEATPVPETSGRAFIQVLHRETCQPLMRPVRVGSDMSGRVVHVRVLIATSSLAFLIYSEADGDIGYVAIDLTALTVTSPTLIVTNLRNDSYFGRFEAVFRANGDLVLAFEADVPVLAINRYTRSGSTFSPSGAGVVIAVERILSIAMAEDVAAGRIGVIYCITDGSDVHDVGFLTVNSSTMAQVVAPVTVHEDFRASQVDIYHHSSGKFGVAYSGTINNTGDIIAYPALISKRIAVASGADVADTEQRSMGVALLSRAFVIAGLARAVFASDSRHGDVPDGYDSFNSLTFVPSLSSYLLEIDDEEYDELVEGPVPHRLVGKIDHDIAAPFMIGVTPHAAVSSSLEYAYALTPFQASAAPASFNMRAGLRLVRATATPANMLDPHRSVAVGLETYINGARMSAWDGGNVFDYGMRTPRIVASVPDSEIGSMAEGNYIYQVNANYRSRVGMLHRGPMSSSLTATGAIGSVTIVLLPSSIDGKQNAVTNFGTFGANPSDFDVFRTEVGGSVLYKLTHPPRYNTLINDPNELALEFVDMSNDDDITADYGGADDPSVPDVPLSTRPQPYTATGEFEDVQPPAPSTMCFHLGRIITITGGGEMWFTKDMQENPGIAPGFNPAFIRLFDKRPKGVVSFVDRVIVFFERGAKFMVGDGPTVAGTDDRFSTPQTIQGDIGTTNPRSIVVTPIGVFFQETGGDIYLLDSALAMQWIGKDVRDTLETYPTVTSAAHVPDESEVRFVCEGEVVIGEDGEGPIYGTRSIILVHDYMRGTWSTRTAPADERIADSILCGGRYFVATSSGIWEEVPGTFIDFEGEYKPSTIVLNPLSPSGPASWHRVKRVQLLGTSLSPHGLSISVARDFAEATEQTQTWADDSDVTAVGPLERAQIALAKQKLQAIEVHITDAAPEEAEVGSGEGFQLEGVALLVKAKEGLARITASRRG
ncbi:MAG TPA: hypothetical protein VFN70_18170 [Burkholderiales bacterium]|nr:hypothetical protein [Burkholderiales bacterium]